MRQDNKYPTMNTIHMHLGVTIEVNPFTTLATGHWNSAMITVFMHLEVTFDAQTFTTVLAHKAFL